MAWGSPVLLPAAESVCSRLGGYGGNAARAARPTRSTRSVPRAALSQLSGRSTPRAGGERQALQALVAAREGAVNAKRAGQVPQGSCGAQPATLALTNSMVGDQVAMGAQCDTSSVTVTGNTFTGGAVSLQYQTSSVVSGNQFVSSPLTVSSQDLTGVALSGPNTNTFSGTAAETAVTVSGSVPANESWSVSLPAADVLVPNGITVDGSLTLLPGTIVKNVGQSELDVTGGSLIANGTSSEPVVFTSMKDDSVGGDTNGDGPSTGSPGDWAGIAVSGDGASLKISNARIEDASTAIDANTSGAVLVTDNVFESNVTALDVIASVSLDGLNSTNAAIHGNWFDGNAVAMTGVSVWFGAEASKDGITVGCHYLPEMAGGGNKFGPTSSS